MNRPEFKRFCMILHVCANHVQSCAGDILIDLPSMWYLYEQGIWPMLIVRKNGADKIERYEECLREQGLPHSTQDCLEYAKKSLGIDFVIEITPYLVKVKNFSLDKHKLSSLIYRLDDYGEVEIVD